jgi:rhodanese-related sulfurtransferase
MFRKRVKDKLRNVAIKAFGMEFDTEERDPNAGGKVDPATYDPSVIPKLVDGDGDTPGPNHKEDIGRTWVAAQLAGGVAPLFVDIRSPQEMAPGVLPGSLRFPATTILEHLERLPPKTERVTIVDQTGAQGSVEAAQALREQGWTLARRLRGGYAEWIEHGETTETPVMSGTTDQAVGDTISVGDTDGAVVDVSADGSTWVWTTDELLVQVDQ